MKTLTQDMIEAGVTALGQHYKDSTLDGVFAQAAVRAVWIAMSNESHDLNGRQHPQVFLDTESVSTVSMPSFDVGDVTTSRLQTGVFVPHQPLQG